MLQVPEGSGHHACPPPGGKSCNIVRQRGPLGSEESTGPRQTSPNAEIHHDGMHACHLDADQSLACRLS